METGEGPQVGAVHHGNVTVAAVAVPHLRPRNGLRELGTEIHLAELGPTGNHTVTLYARGAGLADLGVDDLPSPTAFVGRMVEVEEDTCRLLLIIISIAVHTGALCGRQFRLDAVVLQQHAVITGLGLLLGMGKARLRAPVLDGQHQDVDEVGSPRAAQPCVGKSENRLVVIIIAGSLRPVRRIARVGRKLHHAERHGRAGIVVAAQAVCHRSRTDKRIHIAGHVLRHSRARQAPKRPSPYILSLHTGIHYLSSTISPFFR